MKIGSLKPISISEYYTLFWQDFIFRIAYVMENCSVYYPMLSDI